MTQEEKYQLAQTKVKPEIWVLLNALAKRNCGTVYALFQMFADVAVRMMDKNRNLTKEAATCMAVFDNLKGWNDAFNLADPTVKAEIGEALYIMQDPEGNKHGFRGVFVTKPYFDEGRTMTFNVQYIISRVIELLFPSLYHRMRKIADDRNCATIFELIIDLVNEAEKESDAAALRAMFEENDYSEFGIRPADKPYRRRHNHMDMDLFEQHEAQYQSREEIDKRAEEARQWLEENMGFKPFDQEW